ncbi:MAG: CNNM domain-containing protein, partial [Gammaproteobacteria bacterium]|nr:CNNM domain-containing protein [Gammaproteobacteria bacterium]
MGIDDPLPNEWLFGALAVLLLISAFFSGTETALMSINRYRLRHSARNGHRGAQLTEKLLQQPDRLIGLILLGNNLSNLSASAIATLIAARIGGVAVILSVVILTLVVLIFAELAPKTLAILKPARLAIPAAYLYYPLLKITYPFVWLINAIANGLLFLIGVRVDDARTHSLSTEELRTVVNEAAVMVPGRHRRMLTAILDLEKASVDDIMIPRQDIVGIDLDDNWSNIESQLNNSTYTRLPVFDNSLDNTIGMLHLRKVIGPIASGELDVDGLKHIVDEPYFVPEGTSLNRQLLN